MKSSAPADQAGPDLSYAWKLATNINVRASGPTMSRQPRKLSISIRGPVRSVR